MDELPKHARALLDAAQHADDPSALARARADAGARAAFARHGIHDLPNLRPAKAALDAGSVGARSAFGLKVGIVATAAVGAVIGAHLLLSPSTDPRPQTPSRSHAPPAPVEPAANERRDPVPRGEPEQPSVEAPAPQARTARRAHRAAAAPPNDAALARELKVLAAANELVRDGRYDGALQLLERTKPGPAARAMREERAALRVLALCGRGPDPQARRERERFLTSSPKSLLAARVRGACAEPPVLP